MFRLMLLLLFFFFMKGWKVFSLKMVLLSEEISLIVWTPAVMLMSNS